MMSDQMQAAVASYGQILVLVLGWLVLDTPPMMELAQFALTQ
jgi:hypothetical protein